MKLACIIGIHKWELRMQKGVNDYFECKDCGARKYRKRYGFSGYSPVDWKWLKASRNPQYTDNMWP